MKIVTGIEFLGTQAVVDAETVRFVMPDGQQLFEVSIGKDGASLEIRAPDNCKVNGRLHSNRIRIEPNVANSITLRTAPYDE